MKETNFLIGRGELLTYPIGAPKHRPTKAEVYSLPEAIQHLAPQFKATSSALDELPKEACPSDFGVARLVLNPSYIAKSFFPAAFLRAVNLESIGSRTVKVTPRAWTKKRALQECTTTEMFVAGKRKAFRELGVITKKLDEDSSEALDLAHLESFGPFLPNEKLVAFEKARKGFFEIALHRLPYDDSTLIEHSFAAFAQRVDVKLYADLSFRSGNLWFVPAEGSPTNIKQLAAFAFVRVIRRMPNLRGERRSGLQAANNAATLERSESGNS